MGLSRCAIISIGVTVCLSIAFTIILYSIIHLVPIDQWESNDTQRYYLYPFALSSEIYASNVPEQAGSDSITGGCTSTLLAITDNKNGIVNWLQVQIPLNDQQCTYFNAWRALLITNLILCVFTLAEMLAYCICKRCPACGILAVVTYAMSVAGQWIALSCYMVTQLGQGHTGTITPLQSDTGHDWLPATMLIKPHTTVALLILAPAFSSLLIVIGISWLIWQYGSNITKLCPASCRWFRCCRKGCCQGCFEDGVCCSCCEDDSVGDINASQPSRNYFRVPNHPSGPNGLPPGQLSRPHSPSANGLPSSSHPSRSQSPYFQAPAPNGYAPPPSGIVYAAPWAAGTHHVLRQPAGPQSAGPMAQPRQPIRLARSPPRGPQGQQLQGNAQPVQGSRPPSAQPSPNRAHLQPQQYSYYDRERERDLRRPPSNSRQVPSGPSSARDQRRGDDRERDGQYYGQAREYRERDPRDGARDQRDGREYRDPVPRDYGYPAPGRTPPGGHGHAAVQRPAGGPPSSHPALQHAGSAKSQGSTPAESRRQSLNGVVGVAPPGGHPPFARAAGSPSPTPPSGSKDSAERRDGGPRGQDGGGGHAADRGFLLDAAGLAALTARRAVQAAASQAAQVRFVGREGQPSPVTMAYAQQQQPETGGTYLPPTVVSLPHDTAVLPQPHGEGEVQPSQPRTPRMRALPSPHSASPAPAQAYGGFSSPMVSPPPMIGLPAPAVGGAPLAEQVGCVRCKVLVRDTMTQPCGHLVMCSLCAQHTHHCPICGVRIQRSFRCKLED